MPEETSPASLLLLAGERGAGKSTCCLRVARLARERGWRAGGLVTRTEILRPDGHLAVLPNPAEESDLPARDVRLHLVDLSSGEERVLGGAGSGRPDAHAGPRVGRFQMDASVFAWGIDRARRAQGDDCDLLILDEIGPLELEQRLGFAPLLDDLTASRGRAESPARLVAVRAWLADPLRARLDLQPATIVRLEARNRDRLPAVILSRFSANRTTAGPPSHGEPHGSRHGSRRGRLEGNLPAMDP